MDISRGGGGAARDRSHRGVAGRADERAGLPSAMLGWLEKRTRRTEPRGEQNLALIRAARGRPDVVVRRRGGGGASGRVHGARMAGRQTAVRSGRTALSRAVFQKNSLLFPLELEYPAQLEESTSRQYWTRDFWA